MMKVLKVSQVYCDFSNCRNWPSLHTKMSGNATVFTLVEKRRFYVQSLQWCLHGHLCFISIIRGKGHIFHSMTITIYRKRTEEKLTI